MFNREKKDIGNYQLSSAFNRRVDSKIVDEREQDMSVDIHLPVAKFNGTSSYIDTSIIELNGDFTISCKVVFNNVGCMVFSGGGAGSGTGLELYRAGNGSLSIHFNGAGIMAGMGTTLNGSTYAIKVIRTGTELSVYIDNVLRKTTTKTDNFTIRTLGMRSDNDFWLNGSIADFKVITATKSYHFPLCSTPLGWDAVNNTIHPVNNVELEYVERFPELVTNGGFSNGLTGWDISGSSWTIENTAIRSNGAGISLYLAQSMHIGNGRDYVLKYKILHNSLNGLGIGLSTGGALTAVNLIDTIGVHVINVKGVNNGNLFRLYNSGSNTDGYIVIDYISITPVQPQERSGSTLMLDNGAVKEDIPLYRDEDTIVDTPPTEGYGVYAYDDDESNIATYGNLYTYKSALRNQTEVWKMPSDEEFKVLERHIGMAQAEVDATGWRGTVSNKLKIPGFGTGTDEFGFSAVAGGHRTTAGVYNSIDSWCVYMIDGEFRRTLGFSGRLFRDVAIDGAAYSVRLIQSTPATETTGTTGTTIIHGKTYNWVVIGTQKWMSENLASNIDAPIVGTKKGYYPNPTLNTNPRHPAPTTGVYAYNNDENNVQIHGRLYDYPSAKYMQPLAQGWKMPSDGEFKQLERYIGMDAEVIGALNTVTALNSGLSIINNKLVFDGTGSEGASADYRNGEIRTGIDYKVIVTVESFTQGNLGIKLGGTSTFTKTFTPTIGNNEFTITADLTGSSHASTFIRGYNSFAGVISAISIKPVEVDATGWRGTVANKLKAVGFGNGTDDFGFKAIGGGVRLPDGTYVAINASGRFITSSIMRELENIKSGINRFNNVFPSSVRYIQAAPATETTGTTGTVTFYGKSYNWVVIGTQKWMSENFAAKLEDKPAPELIKGSTFLNYTPAHYNFNSIRNLDKRRFFDLSDSNIYNLVDVKYPNNDINNLNDYGGLYKYADAVEIVKDISADGWRLPTETDANLLITSAANSAENIKTTGTAFWDAPNANATNITGFSCKGAGTADSLNTYAGFRTHAYIWLSNTPQKIVKVTDALITIAWLSGYYVSTRYMRPTTQPHGTTSTVTIKGVVHNTVVIGTQEWMSESLKIDGSNMLPFPSEPLKWDNETLEKLKYVPEELLDVKYPNGDVNNLVAYGGLCKYSLAERVVQSISVNGWRVPINTDVNALRAHINNNTENIKAIGTTYWNAPNTNANNTTGFDCRGAGYSNDLNSDLDFRSLSYMWLDATMNTLVVFSNTSIFGWSNVLLNYHSVRYMRDTTQPHGTTSTVIINGTTYNTIVIGTQEWMSESLRETKIDEVLNPFIKAPFQQIIKLCLLDNYEDKLKLDREYNDA